MLPISATWAACMYNICLTTTAVSSMPRNKWKTPSSFQSGMAIQRIQRCSIWHCFVSVCCSRFSLSLSRSLLCILSEYCNETNGCRETTQIWHCNHQASISAKYCKSITKKTSTWWTTGKQNASNTNNNRNWPRSAEKSREVSHRFGTACCNAVCNADNRTCRCRQRAGQVSNHQTTIKPYTSAYHLPKQLYVLLLSIVIAYTASVRVALIYSINNYKLVWVMIYNGHRMPIFLYNTRRSSTRY
jgi:hypothetical protein